MLSHLIDGRDVRMIEAGGRLGLHAEAAQLVGRGTLSGKNHLERHDAVQADLPGPVNDPHAAAGDLIEQFVVAQEGVVDVDGPAGSVLDGAVRIRTVRIRAVWIGDFDRRPPSQFPQRLSPAH